MTPSEEIVYCLELAVHASLLSPTVDKLQNEINETMHGFGFDEKMIIKTNVPFKLRATRRLSQEEKNEFAAITEKHFRQALKVSETDRRVWLEKFDEVIE